MKTRNIGTKFVVELSKTEVAALRSFLGKMPARLNRRTLEQLGTTGELLGRAHGDADLRRMHKVVDGLYEQLLASGAGVL